MSAPDPDLPTAVPESTEGEWSRLSPRMLLIHPLGAIRSLLPALIPLLVVGNSGDGRGRDVVVNASTAALVLVVAAWRWATTRYRLTEHQVQLRQGLLKRTTLTLPLDRVRTVDLQSSLVHRLLGLTKAVIGTGAHADKQPFVLDGLTTAQAERLRVRLLHERTALDATADAPAPTTEAPVEQVLVAFDPAWVRFAPLSTAGLATGIAVLFFVAQTVGALGLSEELYSSVEGALAGLGILAAVVALALALAVTTVVGAVTSYLLTSWDHTVRRHDAGTLRISRGLLTTRSTTIDLSRVRGIRLREGVLLRLAHGAQLSALVTGFGARSAESAGLLPASPLAVDRSLAALVLGTAEPLDAPLVGHGPRARRRRWFRAVWTWAFVAAPVLAGAWWWGWGPWTAAPLLLLAALLVPVAADRARSLGHAVTTDHLVAREGSIDRATSVLDLDGIIGWEARATIFQRRVGLVTLTAMTAAGDGGVRLLDVPVEEAEAVVAATASRVGVEARG